MKFKYLLTIIALAAISQSSFAQYSQDAIRYSTFQTGTTSRVKGIGNAGTAIGGDLSSVNGNPAGLGFFTKSELSITPEFNGSKVNSSFLGQSTSASKNSGNLNNASIVFYSRLNTQRGQDKTKGWLSLNFGFGYSRTNDYGENIYAAGKNNTSSITDYYANLANSNGIPDGSLQSWAYNQNLIDQYGVTNPTYQSNTLTGAAQLNNISRSGGQSEFDLSVGANHSNRLYLGLGLGLTNLQYNSTNNFTETGMASILENNSPVTRNYTSTYSQLQDTKGSGVNVKFGAIYKLLESLRIGAVITTPTYYSINDSYNEGLSTNFNGGASYQNGPTNYPLSYSLRTPFKFSGGLALFIKQFGFISGDVEYVDYSTTHLSNAEGYDSSFDNNNIKTLYRAAINAHAGAEARLTGSLFLRGGYGVQGSPLKQNGKSTQSISGGLGYHFGSYYMDAAYMHVTGSQLLTPYDAGNLTQTASLNKTNNNVFLTLGYRY
ncbi:MAG: hypothetical protein JWR67_1079 [Mucilaginibacter sp.]|nr:hypothetical protein [Mucilaginibacter sp.]